MLTIIEICWLLEDMGLYQSKLEFGEILVRDIQPLLNAFLGVTEWFTLNFRTKGTDEQSSRDDSGNYLQL